VSGAECNNISGATKSTYTAVSADESRTLVADVTAANAVGSSIPASSAPSGVVGTSPTGTPHWHACQAVAPGTGTYSDAACSKEVGVGEGSYAWTQLSAGTPTSFTSKNTTPMKLKFISEAITYTLECSSESGKGTVLNPTGGGAGTLTGEGSLVTFTGCTQSPIAGCTVKDGQITGYAVNGAGNMRLSTNVKDGPFFSFSLPGCGFGESNMIVTGALSGAMSNISSSLIFTSTSGSELKNAGLKTWVEGTIKLTTTEGGALKLAP
jgi:hypothetical protein